MRVWLGLVRGDEIGAEMALAAVAVFAVPLLAVKGAVAFTRGGRSGGEHHG